MKRTKNLNSNSKKREEDFRTYTHMYPHSLPQRKRRSLLKRGSILHAELHGGGEVSHLSFPKHTRIYFEGSVSERDRAFLLDLYNDSRSWGGASHTFGAVTRKADADVIISMTTTEELRRIFPSAKMEKWSITNAASYPPHIYFNTENWNAGHRTSGHKDITAYRHYVGNHEMGHAIGYSHKHCTTPGKRACIMQQQTHGTQGCLTSEWPSHDAECLDSKWKVPGTLHRYYVKHA